MQQRARRESRLRSFRCDVAEANALVDQVRASLGAEAELDETYEISVGGLDFTGRALTDFKESSLPAEVYRFSIHISRRGPDWAHSRSWRLYAGNYWPSVSAEGEDPSWCAGVVDVTRRFAREKALWYWWLHPIGVRMLVSSLPWLAAAVALLLAVSVRPPRASLIASGIFAILATALFAWRFDRIFPASILLLRESESWWNRNSGTVTALAAVVSALAAVIAAILSRR